MANKYNLPHDTKYKVISSNYLSLENGGGTQCDNCNKIITTTVQVEDTEGNSFIVGADCAITLAGIGVFDEKNIKDTVKRCKKFYTAIKNDSRLLIKESKDSYALFAVVDKSYDGKPIKPFIHVPFIGIAKENLSEKFKHLIRTISWIEETYPELKDCYYLTKWKEEMIISISGKIGSGKDTENYLMFNNRYFIIHKARRFGSSYMLRKFMAYINELNKPKLLLPILAKSLWLKDNGYNNTWFSNQLYKKACFIEIKDSLYYQITNRYNTMAYVNQLIEDGKQCAECDVVYERPHWTKVLCVDCFEEKLKKGEVPEFQKASGVEL